MLSNTPYIIVTIFMISNVREAGDQPRPWVNPQISSESIFDEESWSSFCLIKADSQEQ